VRDSLGGSPLTRSLSRRAVALGGAAAGGLALTRLLAGCAGSTPASSASSAGGTHGTTSAAAASTPSGTATGTGTAAPGGSPTGTATAGIELPRGGRQLFPAYRLVGYAGSPGSPAFGRLGIGNIDDRVAEIEKLAPKYAAGRQVLPVLELIAVVAQHFPGKDGLYRVRVGDDVVGQYLAAARRHRAVLLLNIQPGRADFLPEVRSFERWLREPDVGIAMDPEWAVHGGQVPGHVFGWTTGAVVDSVSAYLDGLVTAGGLPQKALIVHQLNPGIVRGFEKVRARPGVALVKSVDGIGSPGAKITTWKRLVAHLPRQIHPGFKLFFEEDRAEGPLMTPSQVLALRPQPEYVLYE
jgi:hypothetical protein